LSRCEIGDYGGKRERERRRERGEEGGGDKEEEGERRSGEEVDWEVKIIRCGVGGGGVRKRIEK
jgi:hypothetical protein